VSLCGPAWRTPGAYADIAECPVLFVLMSRHVAMVMGFQHALAMLGGIISVPLIIGGPFDANLTNEEKQYLISAGLIASGILSFFQIYRLKLGNSGYYMGTGLVSVLGTSFTFVPVLRASMFYMMAEASDTPCKTKADCHYSSKQCLPDASSPLGGFCTYSGREAYGAYLGTAAVCGLLEVFMAFVPRQYLKRCFPPIVTGVCVTCIGVGLTATGLKYWGGGAFCADNSYKRQTMIRGVDVPGNVVATYDTKSPCKGGACVPNKGSLSGVCQYTAPKYDEKLNKTIGDITQCVRFKDTPGPFPAQENVQMSWVKCGDNGEVFLPFGAAEYVGLGFSVFTFLVITEMFGSPFVRNCQVAIALLAGFAVSAIATYNVPGSDKVLKYTNNDKINSAPGITFLWVETFPLTIYAPAVIPTLICYVITSVETVGDIAATAEASRVHKDGQLDSRIQGGVLFDGLGSILSCLMTTPPNTTFSQNNGVVALTRCANRRAGYCWFSLCTASERGGGRESASE
jgi:xanthine/uracil permease